MNVIQDAAALYSFLQNVTGASGQVSYVHEITVNSLDCHRCMAD